MKREQIIEIQINKFREFFERDLSIEEVKFCNRTADAILALDEQKDDSMIVTVSQRVRDIYDAEFFGHPSREEENKTQEAVFFLAEQIDILHKLRIKK
jgi:hypothetical protein